MEPGRGIGFWIGYPNPHGCFVRSEAEYFSVLWAERVDDLDSTGVGWIY